MIPLAQPWFDQQEAEAAKKVVNSKWLISGPRVEQFEKEFSQKQGVKYAIAVNSGSSALLMAEQALGIKQDDEVIVPNMTFISTATSLLYLKAKPVLTDIELQTYCLNPNDIEKRITKKTKAIIPVHYAGQAAPMDKIMAIAKKHNLKVIEDAAEAHLIKHNNQPIGSFGDLAIFSFTPSKVMTTGEGGMITTNNAELAQKCKELRNYCDKSKFEWQALGFNFRMPEVMAAIGSVQLKKVEEAIAKRKEVAQQYNKAFEPMPEIITPLVKEEQAMNFQLYTIRLNLEKIKISRDQLIEKMAEKGVQTRLYYPALHQQGVFRDLPEYKKDEQFPYTMEYVKSALSLPIFPGLTPEKINHIIESIKQICAS